MLPCDYQGMDHIDKCSIFNLLIKDFCSHYRSSHNITAREIFNSAWARSSCSVLTLAWSILKTNLLTYLALSLIDFANIPIKHYLALILISDCLFWVVSKNKFKKRSPSFLGSWTALSTNFKSLAAMVTGPSLFVICYLGNKFQKKFRLVSSPPPPPPLNKDQKQNKKHDLTVKSQFFLFFVWLVGDSLFSTVWRRNRHGHWTVGYRTVRHRTL